MVASDAAVTIDNPDWANALVREWEKVKGQMRPVLVYVGRGENGEGLEPLPLKVGSKDTERDLRVFNWPEKTYLEVDRDGKKVYYSRVDFKVARTGEEKDAVLVAEFSSETVDKFQKMHGYRVINAKELTEEQVPPPDVAVRRWKKLKDEQVLSQSSGGGGESDDTVFDEYERLVGKGKFDEVLKKLHASGFNEAEARDKLRWKLTRAFMGVGAEELIKRGVELPDDVRGEVQRALERRVERHRGSGD